MSQALAVQPRDTVLEIGTGSGYQAAVLSQLARRVYTIDRHRSLTRAADILFTQMGLSNITVLTGDGSFGLPDQAPFDRILVTAAAEDPPGPLLQQLKVGGIMVVPVGPVRHGTKPHPRDPHRKRLRLRRASARALRAARRGCRGRMT
jgi:protein-L-isoaspartate(D-aspartate) O-methyltransferase